MNVCVTESCSMPGGDGAPATSRQPRGKVKASTVLYCYFLLEKKQDNFFQTYSFSIHTALQLSDKPCEMPQRPV